MLRSHRLILVGLAALLVVATLGAYARHSTADDVGQATVVVRCAPRDVEPVKNALAALRLGVEVEVFLPTAPPSESGAEEPTNVFRPLSNAIPVMRDVTSTLAGIKNAAGRRTVLLESLDVRPRTITVQVRVSDLAALQEIRTAFADRGGLEGESTFVDTPVPLADGIWRARIALRRVATQGEPVLARGPAQGIDYEQLVLESEELQMRLLRASRLTLDEHGDSVTVRQRLSFESGTLALFARLLAKITATPNVTVEEIRWKLVDATASASVIRGPEILVSRRFARSALPD